MKKVFFDTWAWVAIAHKNDTHHADVLSFYKTFLLKNGVPITTDYVLSETITLLRAKTATEGVAVFINTILAAVKEGRIMLERIDEKRWEKAWELSKKYNDKPSISFVDFSSFVAMKELGVLNVLTLEALAKVDFLRLLRRFAPRNDSKNAICHCERSEAILLFKTFARASLDKHFEEVGLGFKKLF